MATDQSWIADLLTGYRKITKSGVAYTQRNGLQFLGSGVTVADNPNSGTTDITINGGGGSSGGQTNITLTNGLNSNINPGALLALRIGGPSAAFQIDGLVAPATSGTELAIRNTTTQTWTIVDASNSVSAAANRIYTGRAVNVNPPLRPGKAGGIAPGSEVRVRYDSTLNSNVGGWLLVSTGFNDQFFYDVSDFGLDENAADNQPAFQAALAAHFADNFRRPVRFRRPLGNTQARFEIKSPIVISNPNAHAIFEGENIDTLIRADAFLGPMIIAHAPTGGSDYPVFTPVQDGSTGFWGLPFTGNLGSPASPVDNWIPLTRVDSMNLNGLAAFTFETWYKPTSATNSFIFSSTGRRHMSRSPTTAFNCKLLSNGHVACDFTTSGSGQQTLTSAGTISNGTRHKISLTYDGSFMRLHIDGVFDSKLAATGTIQQGYEDMFLGTVSTSWPLGGPITQTLNGTLYQTRFSFNGPGGSGGARYATDSNYTPETSPFAHTDANTMLLLDFNPSNFSTLLSALFKATTQWAPAGVNQDTPVWMLLDSESGAQMPGPTLRHFSLQSALGGTGLHINRCPDTVYGDIKVIGTNYGIELFNNCYSSLQEQKCYISIQGQMGTGGPIPPANWGFLGQVGGLCKIEALHVSGVFPKGGYCIIAHDFGALFSGGYWIPGVGSHGGCILVKNTGITPDCIFQYCFPGDEAGIETDHCMLLSSLSTAGAPNLLTLHVTTEGGNFQQTQTANIPIIEIDGGGQYIFGHVFWGQTGTGGPAISFTSLPERPPIINYPVQNTQFSSGAYVPWIPETGTAGQGPLIFPSQSTGSVTINFASDANLTAKVNDFYRAPRIKATSGVSLTSKRQLVLPLIAGESRKIWNATTGGQSITVIGLTGTGIDIAPSASPFWVDVYCDGTNWVAG